MFNWFAFVSYVVVSSITPGPNNLMCMANGTRYGFRKGLKFCFGVALGFSLIVLCAIGCNFFIYEYIPAILKLMTPIGAAYILWLAWTIWRDKPKEKKEKNSCLTFYNLCTSLASMASAMAAESFCQMTADHPVSVFGIMLENRAYMNFITCIILLADAGMVWLLYKKKGTEPRSTPTSE